MSVAPLVLLTHPRLAGMQPLLEAEGWRVVGLWALGDADRASVRALVHIGEIVLAPDMLATLPALGLVANIGAGYDGVDVPWCLARGIAVAHAKGLNAADVADHAIGLMIAAWRNIPDGDRFVRTGTWARDRPMAPAPSLGQRRIGIVGLGAIGTAIARRAEAFGMNVGWWGPREKEAPWPRAHSLPALAEASDILVVACRADAANRGLVSAEIIRAVGPEGLIVNVARGSVVDEDALIAALRDRSLGRAALDVFQEEPTPAGRWQGVPNLLLTPHMAGATAESIPRMIAQAVGNIRQFLASEALISAVPSPGL